MSLEVSFNLPPAPPPRQRWTAALSAECRLVPFTAAVPPSWILPGSRSAEVQRQPDAEGRFDWSLHCVDSTVVRATNRQPAPVSSGHVRACRHGGDM